MFRECKTLQELKANYKKMVYQYHPDRNGNTPENDSMMKRINLAYEKYFDIVKKMETAAGSKAAGFATVDDGYREIIDAIIHLHGVNIEICGSWIWVSGDTKQYKDIFKEAGFSWAAQKKMWFWKPYETDRRRRSGWDINKIRDVYGSVHVDGQPYQPLGA